MSASSLSSTSSNNLPGELKLIIFCDTIIDWSFNQYTCLPYNPSKQKDESIIFLQRHGPKWALAKICLKLTNLTDKQLFRDAAGYTQPFFLLLLSAGDLMISMTNQNVWKIIFMIKLISSYPITIIKQSSLFHLSCR